MFCSQCGQQNAPGAKFCFRCGTALVAAVTSTSQPAATANEIGRYLEREDRAYGTANAIGVLLCLTALVGLSRTLGSANASDGLNPMPNVINMTLLGAFGLAVVRQKRAAIGLGWTYLALLTLMTLAHGLIPLEIAQVLALVWFMFHLRKKLAGIPARSG